MNWGLIVSSDFRVAAKSIGTIGMACLLVSANFLGASLHAQSPQVSENDFQGVWAPKDELCASGAAYTFNDDGTYVSELDVGEWRITGGTLELIADGEVLRANLKKVSEERIETTWTDGRSTLWARCEVETGFEPWFPGEYITPQVVAVRMENCRMNACDWRREYAPMILDKRGDERTVSFSYETGSSGPHDEYPTEYSEAIAVEWTADISESVVRCSKTRPAVAVYDDGAFLIEHLDLFGFAGAQTWAVSHYLAACHEMELSADFPDRLTGLGYREGTRNGQQTSRMGLEL